MEIREITGATAGMNCPFYGRSMYVSFSRGLSAGLPFVLMDSRGNQCGLVCDKYAPCMLERDHEPVEWRTCPLVKSARMEEST